MLQAFNEDFRVAFSDGRVMRAVERAEANFGKSERPPKGKAKSAKKGKKKIKEGADQMAVQMKVTLIIYSSGLISGNYRRR